MTDKDILSQEEIDALLQNVDEDEDEAAVKSSNDETVETVIEEGKTVASRVNTQVKEDTITSVDFFNQERIVRGQLPVLDRIYDRMGKHYAEHVYQMMSKELIIDQKPMKILKYHELMSSLRIPTMINLFRFRPLRGKAMIMFDSTFVFNLVDNYFGGNSQFNSHVERLDFTLTEIRIVDIFIDSLIASLARAWNSIAQLQIQKSSSETNPQLVNINEANDLMLVNRFSTKFDKNSGEFIIVMPYSMIEPIKQNLEFGMGSSEEDIDPNWTNSLIEEMMEVEVNANSYLGESEVPLSKIQQLEAGDFIPLVMHQPITLDVEQIPLFTVKVGNSDEKNALQILNKIQY